uniref:Serpin domain-containing protein n=1 Tax=Sus scrofa TaxID=9823 RepID=A0A4X1SG94_PIG
SIAGRWWLWVHSAHPALRGRHEGGGNVPLPGSGLLVAGLCSRVHCVPADDLASKTVTLKGQIKKLPAHNTAVVSSNTDFAFSLYKQLALAERRENVIFSPLSVSIALAFLSLGARGPTLIELLEGLKFNLTKTPEAEIHQGFQHLLQALSQPSNLLQLNVGNAMFVDERLKLLDKFVQDARELYFSEVFSISFKDSDAAVEFINNYVKNKTKGKIVDLFKQLSPDTVLVLVNCIYFKAKWKMPFNPNFTTGADFHVSKNRTVRVPMMGISGRPCLTSGTRSWPARWWSSRTPATTARSSSSLTTAGWRPWKPSCSRRR